MTVISLVHSNIIRSQSSVYREISVAKSKTKKLLVILLIFAILISGLVYVFGVNSITTKGYQIRTLRKQVAELETVNKNLEINISDLKSISVLESKTASFGMIKAQSIEYLALPSANVATRDK